MKDKFKYTPFYSFVKYFGMKRSKKIRFESKNIGEEIKVKDYGNYTVFRELYILTDQGMKKEGAAFFQVVFHTPKIGLNTVIKRTDFTIPLFSGLPGFCNKKFMVNRDNNTFSGLYEWESAELAKKYADSYAVKYMQGRSKPYPLYYKISDKISGEIIEENII